MNKQVKNINASIFMYHDIRDLEQTKYRNRYKMKSFIRKVDFMNQINFILKNFKVISSLELINPKLLNYQINYAVITFDDGLRDQFSFLEFLKKSNIKATFFIPSESVKERHVFHSHKIQYILASRDSEQISREILSYFKTKDRHRLYSLYSTSQWKNNIWTKDMIFITNFLRNFDSNIKFQICDNLFFKYVTKDEKDLANDLYMNEKECKKLLEHGMEIGGHGHKSLDLRTLSQQEQLKDLKKNLDFLKKLYFGRDFTFIFSYPNGGYNTNTINILNGMNCKLGFTTKYKIAHKFPGLELPRFDSSKYEFN